MTHNWASVTNISLFSLVVSFILLILKSALPEEAPPVQVLHVIITLISSPHPYYPQHCHQQDVRQAEGFGLQQGDLVMELAKVL